VRDGKINPTTADIDAVLNILRLTPRRIESLAKGQSPARLHHKPDEETWSPNEVLAHLRACADVWGNDILKIIAQDHPTLRYVSPRSWIRKTNYPDLTFETSLEAFVRQRKELLKTLEGLAKKEWSSAATFKMSTTMRQRSVFDCAAGMAEHESKHCEQIKRLLNRT